MAKEIPVSEANGGKDSSKLPGMNVENARCPQHEAGESKSRKHRRRRPRKRAKKPKSDVQTGTEAFGDSSLAVDHVSNSSEGGGAGNTDSAQPNGQLADQKSPFDEKKPGKRARRRRRRRRRNREEQDAQSPNTLTPADVGADAGADAKTATAGEASRAGETSSKGTRRRNRRPGNKRDIEGKNAAQSSNRPRGSRSDPQSAAAKHKDAGHGGGKRAGHRHASNSDSYAALDLGTNNCRLLVAVPQQPGKFRVVDAFSRIVRLGEGLGASGRLSDDAMNRAVGALSACADKLLNRQVRGMRLIATEACRRAQNGAEFLHRVEKEVGLKLEVVDRETEARLAVAGCSSLVDREARGVVLFDIGGGSSELALLDLSRRKRHDLSKAMVSWTSLPLGVVTLSEKHGGGKSVTRAVFDDMVDEVVQMLDRFEGRDALTEAASQGEVHLLGTSGTVTTLAGIHLKLPRYDRRRVDGTWMSTKQVFNLVDELVEMSFEDRMRNPCIGKDRADLVLAGCAILVAIQQRWPCPRLRVADRGLREGLLTEMMNADDAWLRRPPYYRARRT